MATLAGIDSAPNQFADLSPIHSPWHDLLTAAMALSRSMEGEMDRALRIVPLRAREFAVLLQVCESPLPGMVSVVARTQRELAARSGMAVGATNELITRLERRGLVQRTVIRVPTARRRGRPEVMVTLTGEGEAVLTSAAAVARRVEELWVGRLARDAAGTDLRDARANGLKRWLTESAAALRGPRAP